MMQEGRHSHYTATYVTRHVETNYTCKPQAHEIFTLIQIGSEGITGEENEHHSTSTLLLRFTVFSFSFRASRGFVVYEVAE